MPKLILIAAAFVAFAAATAGIVLIITALRARYNATRNPLIVPYSEARKTIIAHSENIPATHRPPHAPPTSTHASTQTSSSSSTP